MAVTMMCLTKKQKFEVENPEVLELKNGRHAYRAMCPWKGKQSKDLFAWKFCNRADFDRYEASKAKIDETEEMEES